MDKLILKKIGRVDGEVTIPGSKSYTNRALIMAAIADGESVLKNISLSDDSMVLIECLRKLGVEIDVRGDLARVFGGRFESFEGVLDVGPAGTVMRFLVALCAFLPGVDVTLKGSDRMHRRPIGDLVDALRELHADIVYLDEEGFPPLKIRGVSGTGGKVRMNGNVSSQFFSALLLVAPLIGELEVEVSGEQISKSYLDMTFDGMREFGVEVENDSYRRYFVKQDQGFFAREYFVEGDASGASYFWGLAAASGGRVRVSGVGRDSLQGDAKFPELLKKMGCEVIYGEDFIEVAGVKQLKGIEVDMSSMPDTAQTLAVVAAFAEGVTKITGLSTLKNKETDRLLALKNELMKIGVETRVGGDFVEIYGAGFHESDRNKVVIETYDDHRMAMAFSLLAAKIEEVEILNPNVVSKSFPDFWEKLAALTKS